MSKILSLSEAASIGIHSIILIAKADANMNVNTIAELTGSSKHHVAKIMQRLVKENYLTSNRGPTGGFSLKKNPSEITLLQIYEAIEGQIEISACPVDHTICPFDKCIMGTIARQTTLEFKDYLQNHTIEEMMKN